MLGARTANLTRAPVSHNFWRTVRASRELANYGVCDLIHVESKPGRGAYAVTVLDDWLLLHPPASELDA
jgi:hypothetical protein